MMRTANPALNEKVFKESGRARDASEVMSIQGTVNRTAILLALTIMAAGFTWDRFAEAIAQNPGAGVPSGTMGLMVGGMIGGLIMAIITIFKKTAAPVTAPMYAVLEGLFLGGVSAMFEMRFPGIVMQAVGLTFGTLFALLFAYKSGLIRATENFRLGVVAATGGIGLVYLFSFVMGFFGLNVPFVHEAGLIGIGFSMFVVVIAALNLVLDFDFIEKGAEIGAPKYMEWYAAFGLLVTLVWLYLEILRLLAKLNSRR